MTNEQERTLQSWLAARDPGDAPDRLRSVAMQLPDTGVQSGFRAIGAGLWRAQGLSGSARLVAILALLLVVVAAVGAGALRLVQRTPPGGLIAYVGPLAASGTTGINLVHADGTGRRAVSSGAGNVFDHSPQWSADGRTLAFGRTSDLDPFGACGGVGSIVLYDVATATERVIATGLRPMDAIELTPSGDRIAFLWPPPGCFAPAELGFVDLATGTVTTTVLGDGLWRLQPDGDTIAAVDTTVWEVDARSGELVARCLPRDGTSAGHVEILDRQSAAHVDLGIGWAPAWSPDESSIAFIQVADGPKDEAGHSASLVTAGIDGWQVRTLADITDPDFARFGDIARLPQVQWTSDSAAIYWLDAAGAHVVDVDTGQSLKLTEVLAAASDLRWQPTPRAR